MSAGALFFAKKTPMEKLDLSRAYKNYYKATAHPELVDIAPAQFISITGQGDPGGADYAARLEALYSVAYTLKFRFKNQGQDFVVAKLEGLWWFDEERYKGIPMAETPGRVPREEWFYRMMIRIPDFVTEADVQEGIRAVTAKKTVPGIDAIEFYTLHEGKCVQMLHVGPFDQEPRSPALMLELMSARGLRRNGLHHEIYLSDFRKVAPERYRTILREPVY